MLINHNIEEEIAGFKKGLLVHSASEIVQSRIIFGECVMLEKETYHSLRVEVAKHFGVHSNEVLVVGSAKLGFSIAPSKMYKPFNDSSDIDVVIVSSVLFDKIWKSVYHLWREKIYWNAEAGFQKYLFQGWIRPDKLPISKKFPLTSEWWEFFRKLTSSGAFGDYKISGAIYKDWDFLEGYQNFAVQNCKDQL
jgi:hypothetical protein